MASEHAGIDLRKLHAPFPSYDVEWRIAQSGKSSDGGYWAKVLAYITNRAIMQRLDEVVGPENWKNEYKDAPLGKGVLCGLSIRINGEWVTKWDGADPTDIEAVKGGLSDAMKRAGVQWGIGRYLYNLDEGFAVTRAKQESGFRFAKSKEGTFYWSPPTLPSWALPGGSGDPDRKVMPIASDSARASSPPQQEEPPAPPKQSPLDVIRAEYKTLGAQDHVGWESLLKQVIRYKDDGEITAEEFGATFKSVHKKLCQVVPLAEIDAHNGRVAGYVRKGWLTEDVAAEHSMLLMNRKAKGQ